MPVSRVRASASGDTYAIISTSPESVSCAIAGTSPSSPKSTRISVSSPAAASSLICWRCRGQRIGLLPSRGLATWCLRRRTHLCPVIASVGRVSHRATSGQNHIKPDVCSAPCPSSWESVRVGQQRRDHRPKPAIWRQEWVDKSRSGTPRGSVQCQRNDTSAKRMSPYASATRSPKNMGTTSGTPGETQTVFRLTITSSDSRSVSGVVP